jgi:putative transposase
MSAFLLGWFRLIWLFSRGHQALVLENLALRQQLAVYKRHSKRPRLRRSDRMFWIVLAGLWKGWRRALVQVHPDTVVRWQRQRFRRYWAQRSCKPRRKVGRPSIGEPIRDLIQTMARANSLWRAPRIHGELLKLGIKISERTVSRILRTVKRPPSQSWKTFLQNHLGEIVAIDFFTVSTVRMRVLFVFIVLEHQRRKVLHFGVTEHPTAEWVGQQVVEAFAEREAPRYLIRDRDARLLKKYLTYYHGSRTHLGLGKDAPEPRAVMSQGKIIALPQVGGLHHRYERRAA